MTLATDAPRCSDCGDELRTKGAQRCRSCAMRRAQASRGPSRRRQPDRDAVREEAARLSDVLEEYHEEWERA